MFIDEAFFGLARAGKLDGGFEYPGILRSGNPAHLSMESGNLTILGQAASRTIVPGGEKAGDAQIWETEDLAVIGNGAELLQRPRKLVEAINFIHGRMGYSKLIYLQGVADPYLLPVLVYAGISLIDDSTTRIESRKGVRFTVLGREKSGENSLDHNVGFLEEMFRVIRESIGNSTLRELLEKYQISSKALELLRLLDNDSTGIVEEAFPRRTPYIKANSLESLRRPDLARYRKYIAEEYRKPEGRQVAVLLPCSARKPYSSSRSHRKIIDAMSGYRQQVHEIIVTSPVGVVPRDLEGTYPAIAYDIPVIGEWYEDEKAMIKGLLEAYFRNNSYSSVIAFITEDLMFIRDSLPPGSIMIEWKGSPSLTRLRDEVARISSEIGKSPRKSSQKMETFMKMAEYQFGSWISNHMEGCRIVRNYNTDMLVRDGKPVLVYNDRVGKFTINKASAPWFIEQGKFLVEIDDFKPTANIYAVGVISASHDIRQEDEVVLHHGGEVRGVGIAKMPFRAMADLKKGVAVKVRN